MYQHIIKTKNTKKLPNTTNSLPIKEMPMPKAPSAISMKKAWVLLKVMKRLPDGTNSLPNKEMPLPKTTSAISMKKV